MSCSKCGKGQSEPALLSLVKQKLAQRKDCNIKEFCTMRECINEKAGADAVYPPGLWDTINDLLKRIEALENGNNQTITLPAGRYLLSGSMPTEEPGTSGYGKGVIGLAIPFTGTAKAFILTASHKITSFNLYKDGWLFYGEGQGAPGAGPASEPSKSVYMDVYCQKGDTIYAEIWDAVNYQPDSGNNNNRVVEREASPIEEAEIALFKQQGVWPQEEASPRVWNDGKTTLCSLTIVFDGEEQTVPAKGFTSLPIPQY